MCQPGRPSPHGLSHFGSPALDAFQSTMLSQCDDLALEAGGNGGGAAAEGVLINFDD